jgi:hypothetical protein
MNNNYFHKYIKYKNKYKNLKTQVGGNPFSSFLIGNYTFFIPTNNEDKIDNKNIKTIIDYKQDEKAPTSSDLVSNLFDRAYMIKENESELKMIQLNNITIGHSLVPQNIIIKSPDFVKYDDSKKKYIADKIKNALGNNNKLNKIHVIKIEFGAFINYFRSYDTY